MYGPGGAVNDLFAALTGVLTGVVIVAVRVIIRR